MKIGGEINLLFNNGMIERDDQAGVIKRQNSTLSLKTFITVFGIKGIGGKA